MMGILTTVLAFVAQAAPMLTSSAAIAKGIALVAEAVPLAIETGSELMGPIKVAIAALRGNANSTAEQLDQLDAMEKTIDAAYDAASAAAKVEDEAAGD